MKDKKKKKKKIENEKEEFLLVIDYALLVQSDCFNQTLKNN